MFDCHRWHIRAICVKLAKTKYTCPGPGPGPGPDIRPQQPRGDLVVVLFVGKQVERFACQLVICLPPG